jgi:coatomer subunit beta'
MWNSNTYRLEKTLNYGMERVWCVAYLKGSNLLALGYDEGTVMVKLGSDEPAMSMDNSGKIVYAQHNEIQMMNVKTTAAVADGEPMQCTTKELGNTELFPQSLQHDSKGRFVVVCGDGEFVIYTALAWRNKAFGQALEFVWADDGTGDFCVRESASKIAFFKNFKQSAVLRPDYSAEKIFAGALLGVRSSAAVTFYDWKQTRPIRKIEVCPTEVYWSDTGEQVALVCEKQFYVLQYNRDLVDAVLASGAVPDDDGIEDAFEVLHEVPEAVATALWVGDCFVFTNKQQRLNYFVGGELFNIAHLSRQMFLLGYLAKEGRLYLADKDLVIVSYQLQTAIINYQTAILRGDLDAAERFLPKIPPAERNRVAHFLEAQGLKDVALQVSTDPDHRFDLAVALGQLDTATAIADELQNDSKWKQLSDLALRQADFVLAERSMRQANDLAGLLLLYSSLGQTGKVRELAQLATAAQKHNIAFVCLFLLRDVDGCIDLLCSAGRAPEAAFFARTYRPSRISEVVSLWRVDLADVSGKAAESLADPVEFPNLFPELQWALRAEKENVPSKPVSYAQYASLLAELDRDLIAEVKAAGLSPIEITKPAPAATSDNTSSTSTTTAPAAPAATSAAPAAAATVAAVAATPVTPPAAKPVAAAAAATTTAPAPTTPTPAPKPVAPAPAVVKPATPELVKQPEQEPEPETEEPQFDDDDDGAPPINTTFGGFDGGDDEATATSTSAALTTAATGGDEDGAPEEDWGNDDDWGGGPAKGEEEEEGKDD